MRKTLLALAAFHLLAGLGNSRELSALPENTWIKVPPKWSLPNGLLGSYQERGWCTMRYNSRNGSLVFYEGFGPSVHGSYCIYANSLYQYYPQNDTIELTSLSNWFCDEGATGTDIHALDVDALSPTPRDRHTTAQFAYVPSNNRVYLCHGASMANKHPHDFWAYSFDDKKWDSLGLAPGGTEGWDCTCSQNLIYNSNTDELYFFLGRSALYVYGIKTKAWRTVNLNPGAAGDVGTHGTYDSKRNLFVFYGNDYTSDDHGSTIMGVFDANTNTWSNRQAQGSWPPAKSYASIEYNSSLDVYMLYGGYKQNDTWIYFPSANTWRQLAAPASPDSSIMKGTYVAYDATHNLLATLVSGNMWLLRYRPTGADAQLVPILAPDRGPHGSAERLQDLREAEGVVYDIFGKALWARDALSPGERSAAGSLPSGVYFTRHGSKAEGPFPYIKLQ